MIYFEANFKDWREFQSWKENYTDEKMISIFSKRVKGVGKITWKKKRQCKAICNQLQIWFWMKLIWMYSTTTYNENKLQRGKIIYTNQPPRFFIQEE